MQVSFPTGEYLRTLRILKSGVSVWSLPGVHIDTTNLVVPHQVKPPFTFQLEENDEVVYSADYDSDGKLVESLTYPKEEIVPNLIEESVTTNVKLSSEVKDDLPDDS